ncbi:hypothetical protein ACTGJ9_037845 [Bradyrhizobium sp. RDM12]
MTAHERPLGRGIEIGSRRFVPFPANLEIIIQMTRTIPAGLAMGMQFSSKIKRQFAALRRASSLDAISGIRSRPGTGVQLDVVSRRRATLRIEVFL